MGFFCIFDIFLTLSLKRSLVFKVILIAATSVDIAAVGKDLDNSVGNGVQYLIVVRGEQNISLKGRHTLVNRCNRLKVEMVGRLIDNKHI